MDSFQKILDINLELKSKYFIQDSNWDNSPFKWLLSLSSSKLGAVGKNLVCKWLEFLGCDVILKSRNRNYVLVNDKKVSIRFSTLWQSNIYKFQQIRKSKYEYLLCFGLSPCNAHCWIIPHEVVEEQKNLGNIRAQHCGIEGKDTSWFAVDPNNVPMWLRNYGGNIDNTAKLVYEFFYK